ncbi:putative proline dehydrogenase, mitochondrial [Fulvia fulva]|uniref:Proline dehydrogenase n=1 Tax=Passalora fulva TaxID=5499 RepID=A0A9Q8UT49_PASFU|nr:putative proline dehydrogenase, mitochondrial [Fulvia fulva]KAK4613742.1 putative proline dehydrogenase, mitochondrial [Fulvia fulva]KAK4614492.1 putative proline dehydrogenase, mitochondrial [Fulvia fulva]UJO21473.1 putative proline dehydrogenase, mitochondrial [Fulvia fulva]WPV20530.1 putative proline dehydrogenase, mitochondrial [Fulvia fulva]WPV35102.1 putative proline dehydrogenase, mitochondrial [Fulvia fulva]
MFGRTATTSVRQLYASTPFRIVQGAEKTAVVTCRRTYSDFSADARDTDFVPKYVSKPEVTAPTATPTGLERMPNINVFRNLLLGTMLTSPILSKIGFGLFGTVTNSKSAMLNPDRNPVLRAIIKPLIYDQFCAGTNPKEIFRTRDVTKGMGYGGIVLCYGKEIQISSTGEVHSTGKGNANQTLEINAWRDGNLETLDMTGKGDWLGMKLTGAGPGVTKALMQNQEPPQEFVAAMDAICQKAKDQNVRLWVDAEQQTVQTAIDRWTIDFMRKWNKDGDVVVYQTIQAYLKASRPRLMNQLAIAEREGWTIAVKLVRGAYIANDQRELIHDTKQDTDDSYNGLVHDMLSGTNLGFTPDKFPRMQLILAGHNPESVAKAWNLVQRLSEKGTLKVLPEFVQLQGMGDELGCKVLQRCDDLRKQKGSVTTGALTLEQANSSGRQNAVVPAVYKCLTWGSIQECMQYLYRRLVENQGGADRMKDGLSAYRQEVWRRLTRSLSFR